MGDYELDNGTGVAPRRRVRRPLTSAVAVTSRSPAKPQRERPAAPAPPREPELPGLTFLSTVVEDLLAAGPAKLDLILEYAESQGVTRNAGAEALAALYLHGRVAKGISNYYLTDKSRYGAGRSSD